MIKEILMPRNWRYDDTVVLGQWTVEMALCERRDVTNLVGSA